MMNLNKRGETYFLLLLLSVIVMINSKQGNDVLRRNISSKRSKP